MNSLRNAYIFVSYTFSLSSQGISRSGLSYTVPSIRQACTVPVCPLIFFTHYIIYIYIVLLHIELLILIVVELSLMIFCGPKYGRGDNYLLPNFYSFCRFLWSQTQEALCKLLSVSTAWLVESHLGSSHWGCCSLGLIQRYSFYRLLSHLSIRSFIKKFFLGCSFWKCNCYSLNYFYVYWTASCHC